jgi:hypothetical protein
MALSDLIRNGVAIANNLTASLQVNVTYEAWTGVNGLGVDTFATPVTLPALVESRQQIRRTADGKELYISHVITLLRPVTPNGAAGRREPIDPRDKFTLPDGATGLIVDVRGLTDPSTSASYYHEVYLGIG